MKKKKKDRFPIMQFPGLDDVLAKIPHPGKLFLEYFEHYKEVKACLEEVQGPENDIFDILVLRDDQHLLKAASIKMRSLGLEHNSIPNFRISSNHIGGDSDDLLKAEKEYFKDMYQKELYGINFFLSIDSSSQDILQGQDGFMAIFRNRAQGDNLISRQSRYKVSVHLQCQAREGHSVPIVTRQIHWEELISIDSPHSKILNAVIDWYDNWLTVKHLSSRGVKINFNETWQQCQLDIGHALNKIDK